MSQQVGDSLSVLLSSPPQPSHLLFWERSTKKCGRVVQEMCPSRPCVNKMESMNLPELWAVNHLIAQTIISTNN